MITGINIACTKLQSLGQFFNSRALLCLNFTFCSDFPAKRPPEASVPMFYVIFVRVLEGFGHLSQTLSTVYPLCYGQSVTVFQQKTTIFPDL